jgi:hypothetical protein
VVVGGEDDEEIIIVLRRRAESEAAKIIIRYHVADGVGDAMSKCIVMPGLQEQGCAVLANLS